MFNILLRIASNVTEAPFKGFRDMEYSRKNYRDTGYLRKKLLEYRILRSSFKDTGYSQKILKYRMFDGKRCWITKYTLFSAFLLMISINESVKQTVFAAKGTGSPSLLCHGLE